MTLNTMFETFRVLILDFDENLCILSRLWLEDQPLALAGSTGSVLILKKDNLVFGKELLIENMCWLYIVYYGRKLFFYLYLTFSF